MLDYHALRRAVGTYLGWGASASSWSSEQALQVNDIIDAGVRRAFYATDPRNGRAIRWHFLTPMRQLATVANQKDYDLDLDIEAIIGPMTYTSASLGTYPVETVPEAVIRRKRQFDAADYTGRPMYVATEQLPSDGITTTRYKLLLWPTPDDVYQLNFTAAIRQVPLSERFPTPPGGERFSGVIRAAVLAEAELAFNDGQNAKMAEFQRELGVAAAHEAALDPDHIYESPETADEIAWQTTARRRVPNQVTFLNYGE